MRLAIGGREFATKTAAKAYVRGLMVQHMGGSITEDSMHWPMMMGVWERSPEFRPGVRSFIIIRNQAGRPNMKALIDGQIVDWSLKSAIAGKRPTPHTQLTLAMRRSIRSQVLVWKNELSEKRCEMCGELARYIEADHIVPFATLMRKFVEEKGDRPEEFVQVEAGFAFRAQDMAWEAAWLEWHRENMQLRPLCRHCHLAETKRVVTEGRQEPQNGPPELSESE